MNTRALSLASGHDPDSVQVVYAYVLSATAWPLVGTLYGLLAAIKLFWPDVLALEWFLRSDPPDPCRIYADAAGRWWQRKYQRKRG